MPIEGVLVIGTPPALYLALTLLPARIGYQLTAIASALLALALLAVILIEPATPTFAGLQQMLNILGVTIFLSTVGGAFAYHAITRSKGPSWPMRILCFVAAGLLGWALFTLLNEYLP